MVFTAAWMTEFQQKSYCDLIVPGTHNSASNNSNISIRPFHVEGRLKHTLFKVLSPFISPWVKCQSMSIYNQMKAGVRFFDLRLSVINESKIWITHRFACQSLQSVLDDFAKFYDEFGTTEIIYIRAKYDFSNSHSFMNRGNIFGHALKSHRASTLIVPDFIPEPWTMPLNYHKVLGTPIIFTVTNYLKKYCGNLCHPLSDVIYFTWHNTTSRDQINNNVITYIVSNDDYNGKVHETNTVYTPNTKTIVFAIIFIVFFRILALVAALVCISLQQYLPAAIVIGIAIVTNLLRRLFRRIIPLSVEDISTSSRKDAIEIMNSIPVKPNINVFSVDYITEEFCKNLIELNHTVCEGVGGKNGKR